MNDGTNDAAPAAPEPKKERYSKPHRWSKKDRLRIKRSNAMKKSWATRKARANGTAAVEAPAIGPDFQVVLINGTECLVLDAKGVGLKYLGTGVVISRLGVDRAQEAD